MLHYAISRLWLFHAELSQEVLDRSPDELIEFKGKVFKEYTSAQCGLKEGGFLAKWKEYPEKVESGQDTHDVYNAIDIDADRNALLELNALFGLQDTTCRLVKFRYRITDYSNLNIITIFELDRHEDLDVVKGVKREIIRTITRFTKEFKLVFEDLQKDGKIIFTPDYFGIPEKLHPFLPGSETDTYYYEEFVFASGNHLNNINDILSTMEIEEDDPSKFYNGMQLHGISPNPVWRLERDLTVLDLTTLMEPQNIIAAEINIYSSIAVVYFSIIKMLNSVNNVNKKNSKTDPQKIKAVKEFSSDDLRQLQLKFGIILKEIVHRKDALEQWQIAYINDYKLLDDFEDKKEMAEKAESLLSVLMDKKDQEAAKRHSGILEAITISFTVLTLCSVYADVVNFIEGPHDQEAVFDILRMKNLVVILFLLLSCSTVYYLFKKRKMS